MEMESPLVCLHRLRGWFIAGAAADRGYDQVERGVLRVPALVREVLGSFVLRANLDQLRLL